MLKVLGTGATSEACLLALDETAWDVHRAIKLCQVTRALGKQVSTEPHIDSQITRAVGKQVSTEPHIDSQITR